LPYLDAEEFMILLRLDCSTWQNDNKPKFIK
jgi:hypothetical protein